MATPDGRLPALIEQFHAADNSRDATRTAQFYAEDVVVELGAPRLQGREAVQQFDAAFYTPFAATLNNSVRSLVAKNRTIVAAPGAISETVAMGFVGGRRTGRFVVPSRSRRIFEHAAPLPRLNHNRRG